MPQVTKMRALTLVGLVCGWAAAVNMPSKNAHSPIFSRIARMPTRIPAAELAAVGDDWFANVDRIAQRVRMLEEEDEERQLREHMVAGNKFVGDEEYQVVVMELPGYGRVDVARMTPSILNTLQHEYAMMRRVRKHKVDGEYACAQFVPWIATPIAKAGWHYVVMEYMQGDLWPPTRTERSLWFEAKETKQHKFTLYYTLLQMALAVKCVHLSGLLHRNVHTVNFLHTGDKLDIRLADFEFSTMMKRIVREPPQTPNSPPETSSESGPRFDVWQLGRAYASLLKQDRDPDVGTSELLTLLTALPPSSWWHSVEHHLASMLEVKHTKRPSLDSVVESLLKIARSHKLALSPGWNPLIREYGDYSMLMHAHVTEQLIDEAIPPTIMTEDRKY